MASLPCIVNLEAGTLFTGLGHRWERILLSAPYPRDGHSIFCVRGELLHVSYKNTESYRR
jgi:hypothetical protein